MDQKKMGFEVDMCDFIRILILSGWKSFSKSMWTIRGHSFSTCKQSCIDSIYYKHGINQTATHPSYQTGESHCESQYCTVLIQQSNPICIAAVIQRNKCSKCVLIVYCAFCWFKTLSSCVCTFLCPVLNRIISILPTVYVSKYFSVCGCHSKRHSSVPSLHPSHQ